MNESKVSNLILHISGTITHKFWVLYYLLQFSYRLIIRALVHDLSKFSIIESQGFVKTIKQLRGSTYGSEEYKRLLEILKPSLDHHYKNNNHHPEHYLNDISKMNLLDLIEMFLDWKSAVKRHADGNIEKSIIYNETRFKIPKEISNIFRNSI